MNIKIAVVGLGYVGLPLAVEFGKKYETIGYDINKSRVLELSSGEDSTLEVETELLNNVLKNGLFSVTDDLNLIKECNVYIITVPTPIDKNKNPVLIPLLSASEMVGKILKKNDVVIYESTVYPGCTEDDCVPVLEKFSNLKYNVDFFCGYSPERINPGDKEHTVSKILKVTSGSNTQISNFVDNLYKSIIHAGTFKASSIKVAEAAKIIENSQRDINIAFVNELSKIFNLIGIDTKEVLEAASTKWNFIKFSPGLVGGHCIGVDPYYLAQKAISLGYNPEIILSGRRINDSMGRYIAAEVIKLMIKKNIKVIGSKVLILGTTFKENCPDLRNSKVIDIIKELESYNLVLDIVDPHVDPKLFYKEYGLKCSNRIKSHNKYDCIILCVAHNEFIKMNYKKIKKENSVLFDVKSVLSKNVSDSRL